MAASFALLGFSATAEPSCDSVATWTQLGGGARPIAPADLFRNIATRQVVLLGESHDNAQHHAWQLHTLAALLSRQPHMAIGFEGFPRAVQPVLDRWVAGDMSVTQFLSEVNWEHNWGYDANHYLPIFQFARLHRVKLIALNVDRALAKRVGRSGWSAIPADEREGVGDPEPASPAYRAVLRAAYEAHAGVMTATEGKENDGTAFDHFVDGMLLWDRAMAEAIAGALRKADFPLVVGIVGRGHVEYGHGVPRQLSALGVANAAVLLPWDYDQPCAAAPGGIADAIYTLPPPLDEPIPPRLGVELAGDTDPASNAIRIQRVMRESIAEQAGLRAGDIIQAIAGTPVTAVHTVVKAVKRQAPGTWLPLTVLREGKLLEVIAKFPPLP